MAVNALACSKYGLPVSLNFATAVLAGWMFFGLCACSSYENDPLPVAPDLATDVSELEYGPVPGSQAVSVR